MSLSDELKALILGIVEGLTEYLPVSSTGHLILAGQALDYTGEKAHFFEVFIQLGAILAVVVLYPRFFLNLFNFSETKKYRHSFYGLDGLLKLFCGIFPILAVGYLFHSHIKDKLFNPATVAVGLIVGALFILFVENRRPIVRRTSIAEITLKDCFLVGLFQCMALWPGMSRSASTIIGALLIGFDRKLAAEFSFLLAVPVMVIAVSYDVYKNYHLLGFEDIPVFAIGFVTSFIFAMLAIKVFLKFLQSHNFKVFAYYRILLACTVFYLLQR